MRNTETKNSLKNELARLFFIAIGVFLFILFFQPFPLDMLTDDNRLLYVTGFGGITFLFSFLILVIIPMFFTKWFKISEWESGPSQLLIILLLIFTITANAFYIRYVGHTVLTLYILFKIFLVSLLPLIILNILYKNKSQELIIEILQNKNKLYETKIQQLESNEKEEIVHIYSDSRSDKISIKYRNIISVQSADNYIEIYYMVKDVTEKKLVRNTLKNIETQLVQLPEFIRCHRTSIVNMLYVTKLERNYSGYRLKMRNLDHYIPVSRQYLILVKDLISSID